MRKRRDTPKCAVPMWNVEPSDFTLTTTIAAHDTLLPVKDKG